MSTPAQSFRLTISLSVLEHLGINLYSNVPAVLSEVVANAWDADASTVRISWNRSDEIVIHDDGTGMTPDDIDKRFLNVGYRRRDAQPGTTAKSRRPMGRKGIGKLSLFSVAGTVRIETIRNGIGSAFEMKLDEIRERIQREGGTGTYQPRILPFEESELRKGTRITLSDLKRRQTIRTPRALKKRVARRFSIVGEKYGFRVFVDGDEVLPADRDYYGRIAYIWTYGDQRDVLDSCSRVIEKEDRTPSISDRQITINGWLATVGKVGDLHDEEGDNLNRIAIFVRGKMAQEDILSDFSERGIYASYLIGELRVDDLDQYDGAGTCHDEDAATTSRQRIVEDDERYRSLRKLVGGELKHIQSRWTALRTEEGTKTALEIPAVRDWVDDLRPGVRAKAKKWLGRLNRIRIDGIDEQKQIIKHAVLAFEFYRINENLERLDHIDDRSLRETLAIFADLDNLESSLYGQIVQQRLRVIRTLEEKVDENALERVIQEYLYDHLWLLDPSWERTDGTEFMERRVGRLIEDTDANLSEEERKSRLDIGYRKTAGRHVVIELKRPDRTISVMETTRQIQKYLSGIRKLLEKQNARNESVEFVLLVGRPPREWEDAQGQQDAIDVLRALHTRIVFYDELLKDAYKAYDDYLKRKGDVDRLAKVIEAIDDYAPETDAEHVR